MEEKTPKLEAPGKGLPFFEWLYARVQFGWRLSKKDTAEKNWKRFDKLNLLISSKIKDLPLEKLHKKVLIPRLKGIEDSSRYWSIAETLEHIEIVAESISGVIEMLARGEVPQKVANVAEYKPKGKYNDLDPRASFIEFNKRIPEKLKGLKIVHQKPYYKHPWLGNFSILQWQWIMSSHSGIHLNQILHIMKEL